MTPSYTLDFKGRMFMKNNNSLTFIIVFMICFVMALPFVIKAFGNNNKTDKIETEEITTIESTTTIENAVETTTETTTILTTEETKKVVATTKKGKPAFEKGDKNYFDDALFIGDSRTVGLYEYSGLNNATFFSSIGMIVYNIQKTTVSIPNVGKVHLNDLLKKKNYGKIYVMLGINELGYDFDKTLSKYDALIKEIKSLQPNAIIFIEANLHVTKSRSDSDKIINNKNINRFNQATKKLSNNKDIFYIDINEVFDDKNGNLRADYTNDNTHVYAKYYKKWGEWLTSKTVNFK